MVAPVEARVDDRPRLELTGSRFVTAWLAGARASPSEPERLAERKLRR
jgi:hypothetical protein